MGEFYCYSSLYYFQICFIPYIVHAVSGPLSFDGQHDLPILAAEIYVIQKQNQAYLIN
jgi:hypothetical protein